jgi:hypothetical protein
LRYGVPNLFGSQNDRLLGSPYRSGRSRHWLKSKSSTGGEARSRRGLGQVMPLIMRASIMLSN